MKSNLLLTLLFSFCFLLGCKNEKAPAADQGGDSIADLEKAIETTLDKTKAQQLTALYQQYIDGHPEDKVTNASYLYKTASLYARQNQYPAAATTLMNVLVNYKGSEVEASSLHLLGDLYKDNLNYPALGQDLLHFLSGNYPNYKETAAVKKSLQGNAKPLADRINEIASSIYDEETKLPNARMARKYITACEVNALISPNDPMAAELLLKAATTARTTARNAQRALNIYDWVYTQFPGYEKAYQALFLKAFTLDNDMKKFDEAKGFYQEFLNKYPNDEFAVSTKFLLDNLGKSDDEIIKQFEKKKGKSDDETNKQLEKKNLGESEKKK
ncbi:MAG: TolA-binding protein [Polaribacter sp.]|jgi:TolA-binding protein